jgi:hypothetical protein
LLPCALVAAPAARSSGTAEDDKRDKLPKKKVAVLIGYSGLGYKGSQMYVVADASGSDEGFEHVSLDGLRARIAVKRVQGERQPPLGPDASAKTTRRIRKK